MSLNLKRLNTQQLKVKLKESEILLKELSNNKQRFGKPITLLANIIFHSKLIKKIKLQLFNRGIL